MLNLVLFGPPGAGKGTQSQNLIDHYHLVHISTGDIFRAHIKNQTALGREVSQLLADGKLVPDDITIAMLEEEVKKNPGAKGFIFDGFPRTVPQAEALDVFLSSINEKITAVIALDVTQEELTRRIAERHKITNRPDDEADKLKKRIDEYFTKTIQVLPYYEAQGKLDKVNGIGNIDTIFADLRKVIDAL
ncbi:adenylate kinase [Mucilaginibacter arboris]|uniref:Adenylate kinase n=1 Tax=Mucilaginibacter arboris TaxID=2682090 RepID=A0A7K1STJ1_9SPHI|nr:adenylate kinase [Mucilaginibacter arboris]MVN20611.1 adenylate kinase [Mucilaginibacter arboris]